LITGNQNVTVVYPASATEGTIKVQGYHVVTGCTSELQESLFSDPVTVSRVKTFTLNANKSFVYCGDTSPVIFTVTPALPCAVYYWNGSQTSTTSNSFQLPANGTSPLTVTVNIVYGGLTVPKSKTLNFKPFPSNLAISGSATVCTSGATFNINNSTGVSSIVWSHGACLAISSGQNTSSCTFVSTSTGDSWIMARVVSSCGKDTLLTFQNGVGSGIPSISSQSPLAYYDGYTYNNICNGQNYNTDMTVMPTIDRSVMWSRIAANPSTTTWYQSGDNIYSYFFYVNQTAAYRISASNACGCTSYDFGFKSITCGGGGGGGDVIYQLSPNPSSSKVTIVPQIPAPCFAAETTLLKSAVIQRGFISLFDQQGLLKKKLKYTPKSEAEIDVSDLKDGIYVLQIYDGNSTYKKTLIVKH